jgi:hypothetical protein
MTSHRTLPVIAERFTIGRVLMQSWHAFAASRSQCLPMTVAVSTASAIHMWWSGETEYYASTWSFFSSLWISSAILSFAIEPITLGILDANEWRHATMLEVRYWMRALKIAIANSVLAAAVYWPVAVTKWFLAEGWFNTTREYALIASGVLAVNAIFVGTLFYLFFPILLVERCSLWSSALRSVRRARPHIWRLAALTMLFWLFYFAVGAIVLLIAHSCGASEGDWIYSALWLPEAIVLVLVSNVTSAVAYRLLRLEREGPESNQLAAVFE